MPFPIQEGDFRPPKKPARLLIGSHPELKVWECRSWLASIDLELGRYADCLVNVYLATMVSYVWYLRLILVVVLRRFLCVCVFQRCHLHMYVFFFIFCKQILPVNRWYHVMYAHDITSESWMKGWNFFFYLSFSYMWFEQGRCCSIWFLDIAGTQLEEQLANVAIIQNYPPENSHSPWNKSLPKQERIVSQRPIFRGFCCRFGVCCSGFCFPVVIRNGFFSTSPSRTSTFMLGSQKICASFDLG